jgi:hypothetical protein
MKILLCQRQSRGWIDMFILVSDDPTDLRETSGQYVRVRTSCVFDPYPDIYRWLQQIINVRFPAEVTVDEEGRGVTFVAEDADSGTIKFIINPWMQKDKTEPFLHVVVDRNALVQAFVAGLTDFINQGYDHNRWYAQGLQDLRDILWDELIPVEN